MNIRHLLVKIKKYIRPLCIVVGFGIVGTLIFISVRAAASYISKEPENGTGTGIYNGKDQEASGGGYTRFGQYQWQGTGFSVSKNQLLQNGKPFLPRGFNMRALMYGPNCDDDSARIGSSHFTEEEMQAAEQDWHANLLRFQISQSGLAGLGDTQYSEASYKDYIDNYVIPKIQLASSHGLGIILSMQTESHSCGHGDALPSEKTVVAWTKLIPAVKAALSTAAFKNVMFELYNEPQGPTTPPGWNQWLNGGAGPDDEHIDNHDEPIVGHKPVIAAVRAAGATHNVLILDGLRLARDLGGVPDIDDPIGGNQIAFAFHGYGLETKPTEWADRFGTLSTKHPVIMTEWHYSSSDCGTETMEKAPTFLKYISDHNIGMTPGPFDLAMASGVIADWKWNPTNCANPEPNDRGSGQLIQDTFAAQKAYEDK